MTSHIYYYARFTIMRESFARIHNLSIDKINNKKEIHFLQLMSSTYAWNFAVSISISSFSDISLHIHFKRLHKFQIPDRFLLLLKYSLVDCDFEIYSFLCWIAKNKNISSCAKEYIVSKIYYVHTIENSSKHFMCLYLKNVIWILFDAD